MVESQDGILNAGVQFSLPPKQVILAPMCGVTDYPFRKIVRKFGQQLLVSEMSVSQAVIRNIQREKSYFDESPIAVQIAGNEPEIMAYAAKIIEAKGASILDINIGCPARKIAINSYAGAYLLQDEELLIKIVKAVKKAIQIPLTLKMRIGWSEPTILDLVKKLENEGIEHIAIHGRTRNQMYNGLADWNYINKVKESTRLKIIGNGDIESVESACEKSQNLDGIMIGRGIYGRPWFLNQVDRYVNYNEYIKSPDNIKDIILEHLHEALSFYGKERGIMMMKKHLGWYIKNIDNAATFRSQINIADDTEQVFQIINEIYK